MTRVVMEAATFLDVMNRAQKVAPTRGSAYDKAAGIVIEIHPNEDFKMVVRATNLDIYFMSWVSVESVEGSATTWRLHAETLANVARALRVTSGQRVTIEQVGNRLQITQNRLKSVLNLMISSDYPMWQAFNPNALQEAPNLQAALSRVEWAASDSAADILQGVRFDGDTLVATDKFRVARFPYALYDLEGPTIIKARSITSVLTPQSTLKVGVAGDYVLIMPDDRTQLKVLRLEGEYIPIERVMLTEKPDTVRVRRTALIELINRILSVRGSDRSPLIKIRIGKGELAGYMVNEDQGMLGDVIETPGYCDHNRVEFGFSHENLLAALNAAPGDDVTIGYDLKFLKRPVYIKGDSGYECWIAVRGKAEE